MATQNEPGDIIPFTLTPIRHSVLFEFFDFHEEVKSRVETLMGKTIEQSVIEVEEEELADRLLERNWHRFSSVLVPAIADLSSSRSKCIQ